MFLNSIPNYLEYFLISLDSLLSLAFFSRRDLTSFFELELQQIKDGDFFVMLGSWKQAYENLALRVILLRKEIKSVENLFMGCKIDE